MKRYLAIAAIALACTACGGEKADDHESASASASGSPAVAESPAVSASVAAAIGGSGGPMQGPRPGKWRLTASSMGQTMPAMEQCIDAQTTMADAQAKTQPAGMNCSEQSFVGGASGGTGHTVCTLQGTTITNDFTITGDMSTAYTIDTVTKMSGGVTQEIRSSLRAERLGDC
jgi:hypothetical protein